MSTKTQNFPLFLGKHMGGKCCERERKILQHRQAEKFSHDFPPNFLAQREPLSVII